MTGREKIVASGGALTRPFFIEAFELAGATQPHVLIDRSAAVSQEMFGRNIERLTAALGEMGAKTSLLQETYDVDPSTPEALEKINEADILYVSGGNTRRLVKQWKKLKVFDHIAKQVMEGCLVASGASAGALVWFEAGHSDSRQYEVPEGVAWHYIRVAGTGTLPGWATVHYGDTDALGRARETSFRTLLSRRTSEWKMAVGIETRAALICAEGTARARDVRAAPDGQLHTVYLFDHSPYVGITALGQNETFAF